MPEPYGGESGAWVEGIDQFESIADVNKWTTDANKLKWLRVPTCVSVCECICMCVCVYACVRVYMHVTICVRTCVFKCTCVCILCVCVCVCTCVLCVTAHTLYSLKSFVHTITSIACHSSLLYIKWQAEIPISYGRAILYIYIHLKSSVSNSK